MTSSSSLLPAHLQIFRQVYSKGSERELLLIADLGRKLDFNSMDYFAQPEEPHISVSLFRRIGDEFKASGSKGNSTRGLLAVSSQCSDPNREAEWNEWYDQVHVPDMLNSKLYHAAYRFKKAEWPGSDALYLAMYETSMRPADAHQIFWEGFRPKWIASGRVIETMRVISAVSYDRLECTPAAD